MAFVAADLTLVNYSGNGFHIWHYVSTGDANNAIDAAGYFNGASNEMNVGDVIFVNSSNGFGIVNVLSNSGGVVDTGDVVTMATDTR
jgi:hypothetical protein